MADPNTLFRIKTNIANMLDQGATPDEVDRYVAGEGVTADEVKQAPMQAPGTGPGSPGYDQIVERGMIFPGGMTATGEFRPDVAPSWLYYPAKAITEGLTDPSFQETLSTPASQWTEEQKRRVGEIAFETGTTGVGSTFKQLPSMARQAARTGAPSLGDSLVPRRTGPVGTERGTLTGRAMAMTRAADATEDLRAMQRQDVRPLPPAFADGPIASVQKQLSETPFIGAPIRENIEETFTDAARAVARGADELSPTVTQETAGTTAQRALDRFATTTFDELEPGVVQELGITPIRPVQTRTAGGAAQMGRLDAQRDAIAAATGGRTQTSRGRAAFGPARTRSERLTQRTQIEDLSDDELGRVIRTPSQQTSFAARAEALYERAYRNMAEVFRRNGTADSGVHATRNTGNVLREIAETEARTGIRRGVQARYGDLQEMMTEASRNQTIATMRRIRTEIGRDLSNYGQYEGSLDREQLSRIYAALSDDINLAMQEGAARLAERGAPRDQIRDAAQAVRDIQVADRFYRMGRGHTERVRGLMTTDRPERVIGDVVRWATEGDTGNMGTVRRVMRTMRPEERDQIASLVMRRLFAPAPGARGIVAESGFSAERALTNWAKMSDEAKDLFFSNPAHRANVEDIIRIARRISDVERTQNFSRTATNAINLGGIGASLAYGAAGDIVTPALIAGSGAAMAYLMSRPFTAAWLVRFMRLRARVRSGTANNREIIEAQLSMIRRLAQRSENDPRLLLITDALRDDVEREGQAMGVI